MRPVSRNLKTLKNLAKQAPLKWPTPMVLLGRLKDRGGEKLYQAGIGLKKFCDSVGENVKHGALGDLMRRCEIVWSGLTFDFYGLYLYFRYSVLGEEIPFS